MGKIKQTPPVKSRVKRQEREREIKRFDLIEKTDKDILFRVECEGGTYIRKLLDDLGQEMGIGAHMLELRRVRAGIFKEDNIVSLYDFEKAVEEYEKGNDKHLREIIIPAEIVSEVYPVVEIKQEFVQSVLRGRPIYYDFLSKKQDIKKSKSITVFSNGRFVGMFKVIGGKEIYAKAEFTMQEIRG